MKKLTIITINYNNASGLKKTLDSVAAQSCQDFEHVIVDGASADASLQMIQDYQLVAKCDIKAMSEPDTGIYNAMNKGIQMATGEYLLFLNSGDWFYSKDVVQKFLELDCAEDIVAGREYFTNGYVYTPPKNEELSYDLLMEWPLMHQSTFIKRSAFDKYGLYDESYRIGGDKAWWLRAIVVGNATYRDVNFFVANFDQSGVSTSNEQLNRRMFERDKMKKEWPRIEIMRQEIERLRLIEQEYEFLKRGKFGWAVNLMLRFKNTKKILWKSMIK